ncbi:HSF-type DNA-binding-domain-containing protein [Vararia minispora EC-137]|uniref:HSF-type DNA-binding-domain-containing protein n=1 Tax=Vararia minispora EC-137 TaxID=1314806 RepID=A0ACB8QW40_9AGAM|nr:HSF-type DNA-binding-domain-containing protein [Vararia minispora EC-137]
MADLAYHQSSSYYHPSSAHPFHDDDPSPKDDPVDSSPQPSSPLSSKPDTKPQATFLTKLYALLERPENQHMIRWDAAGEHIIVERPEQLALHVLPSVYRQSRFASFSRQLNIYGFMRKVNLRNVDPAIDDPDASTWSHPTLNRHSPPDIVANFKRRVPPRLPKPRKRADQPDHVSQGLAPPRSAIGPGGSLPLGLSAPSPKTRARGLSAPGAYNPPSFAQPSSWAAHAHPAYHTRSLPPLTVPQEPVSSAALYSQSPHPLHPISPADEQASSGFGMSAAYTPRGADILPSSQPYSSYQAEGTSTPSWSFQSMGASHSGSISSLLNHSSGAQTYPPTRPTINTSYAIPPLTHSSIPHSASSLSPDSRPATGYSVNSLGGYDDHTRSTSAHYADYHHHRPGSGRPLTPTSSRPSSSKGPYGSTLSVRRERRHSQAMAPYPQPGYDHFDGGRPSSASSANDFTDPVPPRSRSMIQLPTIDGSYGGAYMAQQQQPPPPPPPQHHHHSHHDYAYGSSAALGEADWGARALRPSTSASSLSGASQTSSSAAHTPPVGDAYAAETDIHRYSPEFGFAVPIGDGHGHHHHAHPHVHHASHHAHEDGLRALRYVEPAKGGR